MIVEPSLNGRQHPSRGKTGLLRHILETARIRSTHARRISQISFSIADQALSSGGMFLANIALARTQTKQEYGLFALSYSIFTFLAGLHNGAIVEAFTIYGSGRYHRYFPQYSTLMWRSHILLGVGWTIVLLLVWWIAALFSPSLSSHSLLGLGLTCAFLLSGNFVRQIMYIRRRPDLAARFSLVFFVVVATVLWFFTRFRDLNSFTTFAAVGMAWIAAGLIYWRELPQVSSVEKFITLEPSYWNEHWKYCRWVLVTGFVFQLTNQAFYWLVGGLLSVSEVANLRAMYLMVTPVDQLFIAMSSLVLPMMAFRFVDKRTIELISLWKIYGMANVLIAVVFGVVVSVIGKPMIHLLYGGRFDDVAGLLLPVLAFLPLATGIGNSANVALKSIEKPKLVFYGYLASGGATFLIGIPLVKYVGLRGAAYGMVLSAFVYAFTLLVALFHSVYPTIDGVAVFSSLTSRR